MQALCGWRGFCRDYDVERNACGSTCSRPSRSCAWGGTAHAAGRRNRARRPQATIPLEKDPTKHYRVGPKDVLRVDERADPEISNIYTVTARGNILLP